MNPRFARVITVLGLLMAASAAPAPAAPADFRVTGLRCEHLVNPEGITERVPRLGWTVFSRERGVRSTAWQVLVASSEEILAAGRGDLWDSGRVESPGVFLAPYAGAPLQPRMRCHWKVRVWDGGGDPSPWSTPASWSMGLMEPGDRAAAWIGHDAPRLAAERALAPVREAWAQANTDPKAIPPLLLVPPRMLRHEFDVGGDVVRATVHVTALGACVLEINGVRVGADLFTPGWTDYARRVYTRTYNVGGLVRRGPNAIGAILADGWYCGHLGTLRSHRKNRDYYGTQPRLWAQLEIELADGTRQIVATGPDWKASTGPILEADLLMGETHDARLGMPGWTQPGFDDAGWAPVDVTEKVDAVMEAHPGPPVRVLREVSPVSVSRPSPGLHVYDFGRNFAGFARLRITADAGHRVTLRFGERLNPDGTVYTANLRSARATDSYICRGGGEVETWEPRFTYHGFQYVQAEGLPEDAGPGALTGILIGSDVPDAATFECSDELLNRLFENVRRTLHSSFIEIPTDCPQRDERMGWTGDVAVFARTATELADVAAFQSKWLVDLDDAQHGDGSYPHTAPQPYPTGSGNAGWADAGILCPWELYEAFGDTRVLERHYAGMARFIDWCASTCKGMLRPDSGFGDFLNLGSETPKDLLATAFFAHSTDLMARTADVLGRGGDAARYRNMAAEIRSAFNAAWVTPEGLVKGGTQTGCALALAFDLVPEELRPATGRQLADAIEARGGHLSTGFIGTAWLLDALQGSGRADAAWRLLQNDTFPSWGWCIRQGATSIWEHWDAWTPDKGFRDPKMLSFNHPALGSAGAWLMRSVAGIDRAAPGYGRILIRPVPGGTVTWVRATRTTIRGEISIWWRLKPEGFALDVTIPADTTAEIWLPTSQEGTVMEGGHPLQEAAGVRLLGARGGCTVLETGSGRYAFTSAFDGAKP